MKKVFLDNLPKVKYGNTFRVNWVESVGYSFNFIYNEIEGNLQIISYNMEDKTLSIKYEDYEPFNINTSNVIKCAFGNLLKLRTEDFKVNLGSIFEDNNRNIVIVDKKYTFVRNRKYKKYLYKCNKCGNEDWIEESTLLSSKCGCNTCCNPPKKVVLGINTIWDTDRWMVDLGVTEENAKSYTSQNNGKIEVVCPDCGNKKLVTVSSLYKNKSIGCNCGDGASYPEKFINNVLEQIGAEFKVQHSFDINKSKKYDFCISDIIIETHGIQHYEQTRRKGARTLQEEQDNDKFKEHLALNNGIKHYIVLDCRESNIEWIKKSTLNSKLNELFDLSMVNWVQADLYAIKSNKVKEVSDYWNSKEDWETTANLAKRFNLSNTTISSYLNKGTRLGWCEYNGKEETMKSCLKLGKNGKKVEIFKSGNSLGVFDSCHELERQSEELFGTKLDFRSISYAAKYSKYYKKFTFKYCA